MRKHGTQTAVETAANEATAELMTSNHKEVAKKEMGDMVSHVVAHVAPGIRYIWNCYRERGIEAGQRT